MNNDRQCEVCNSAPVEGVASSAIAPISFGFCRGCITTYAEPFWLMKHMYHECDGQVVDEFMDTKTFVDGEYLDFRTALLGESQ